MASDKSIDLKSEAKAEFESKLGINELAQQIREWSDSRGWFDGFPINAVKEELRACNGQARLRSFISSDQIMYIAAKLALIHTEVSEATEALRDGDFWSTKESPVAGELGKPEGIRSELADIIIRVLDLATALGMDMEAELKAKMAYNASRPHRHGGKLL